MRPYQKPSENFRTIYKNFNMESEREIIKEYSNEELTILWKPKTCIHAAECVKRLPNVYKPNEKPWIQIENSSTEELKAQIDACPSAALSYRTKGESQENEKVSSSTKVEVLKDGPLLVHGDLEVDTADGLNQKKTRTTAFCRCGASANKPYCDGEHNKIGFKG